MSTFEYFISFNIFFPLRYFHNGSKYEIRNVTFLTGLVIYFIINYLIAVKSLCKEFTTVCPVLNRVKKNTHTHSKINRNL